MILAEELANGRTLIKICIASGLPFWVVDISPQLPPKGDSIHRSYSVYYKYSQVHVTSHRKQIRVFRGNAVRRMSDTEKWKKLTTSNNNGRFLTANTTIGGKMQHSFFATQG